MRFFNLFKKKKGHFEGVRFLTTDHWNSKYCPDCKRYSLDVDEYEKIPIALCDKCGQEFQLKSYYIGPAFENCLKQFDPLSL